MGRFVVFEIQVWLFLLLVVLGLLVLAALVFVAWWWLKRHDEQMRTNIQEAAEAEAVANRNRMLIRLDHELKNPLTALRTSAATVREMVREDKVDLDAMVEPVKQLDVSSRRVARLLADLRKLADVESRQIDFQRVDMDRLVHQAVEDARTAPGAQDRMIVVNAQRAPWKLPEVAGEEDLLLSAILNLLGNALKYSSDTDVVELRANEQVIANHRWVVIEVADTGAGIPVDEQATVWEELSRGKHVRSVAGSGMGLALVRSIIQRHGGSVELYSQEGAGTSVRVILPVLAAEQNTQEALNRSLAAPRNVRAAKRAGEMLGTPRRTSKRRLQMVDGQLTDTSTGETFGAGGQPYPQGVPGVPQGAPGAPGVPQGAPGVPQGAPGVPQGAPGVPQGAPGVPQGAPGVPQGAPGVPQGAPGVPQGAPHVPQSQPVHHENRAYSPHTDPQFAPPQNPPPVPENSRGWQQ